jgi:cupin 2 domain-containing protein
VIPQNFFRFPTESTESESTAQIQAGANVRIERIVSRGHSSPPGFWYDQDESEWVMVLSGAASLLFEGEVEAVRMGPGDYIDVPAHQRHRVEWTDPDQDTVWLAVFYPGDGA